MVRGGLNNPTSLWHKLEGDAMRKSQLDRFRNQLRTPEDLAHHLEVRGLAVPDVFARPALI